MNILSVNEAADALRKGEVIIFPTETFFGMGCNALDPDAVGKIFSIKKRALTKPLPVAISAWNDLDRIAVDISETARAVMKAFWPGPLSVVVPALPEVPDLLTANVGRIAVRFSPHPAVAALAEQSGMILVASSANISGHPSVSDPSKLEPELLERVRGVFMMEPLPAGLLPSTVVDILDGRDGERVRILRKGAILAEDLEKAGFTVEITEDCECGR